MSNHDGRDGAQLNLHLVNSFLDLSLVDFVKSAGGLIENENAWFLEEGTSESDSLLLAS